MSEYSDLRQLVYQNDELTRNLSTINKDMGREVRRLLDSGYTAEEIAAVINDIRHVLGYPESQDLRPVQIRLMALLAHLKVAEGSGS